MKTLDQIEDELLFLTKENPKFDHLEPLFFELANAMNTLDAVRQLGGQGQILCAERWLKYLLHKINLKALIVNDLPDMTLLWCYIGDVLAEAGIEFSIQDQTTGG